ncbi:MAG: DNA-directed RNA polymerase subunit beta' [Patescibacteria group bacterium]
MRNVTQGTSFSDFDAVRLAVASASDVMDWSHGEVTRPETINYRTQKPEKDGLFCEKIFGPTKDINPHDSKFKGIRSREAAVDKKGEMVTKSIVRRERMGHITLAAPTTHIWFLRGTPSPIGQITNMTVKNLERIAYFAAYLILSVDAEARDKMLADLEAEQAAAQAAVKARYENLAKEEDADVKALAEAQTKEIDELNEEYELKGEQLKMLNLHALITETDYRNLPDEFQDLIEVEMGADAIKLMLESIDMDELIEELVKEAAETKGQRKKKTLKRLRTLENMKKSGIEPKDMVLTVIPVIPPDLRPMVQLTGGRFATSDLNDLYRRVINRNNRLKKLNDLNAPEVIRRNEKRMLQEAVDSLIDNSSSRSGRAVSSNGQRRKLKSLADMLKGKQGRFRQNLLGKRVDYSGRSVIIAGPTLKMDECGLPKMMALELFKPFVIGDLIENEEAHNIRSATRMIESGETVVWDTLDKVIEGKYVLLNRAPSLHRLSVQAFKPRLIEGKAIQLHPLVCKGFNADFDGDQMAVHLPLSKEAQAEAKELMVATKNLLHPADGSPILHLEQDIVLGCYYLTYDKIAADKTLRAFASTDEAQHAYENDLIKLQTPINVMYKGEVRQTTLGKLIFNDLFPDDFSYQGEPMTKKKIQNVMSMVYEAYGSEETGRIADDLKDLAFEYATQSGLSMGMGDLPEIEGVDSVLDDGEQKSAKIAEQFEQGFITDEERYRLTIDNWFKVNNEVQELVNDQYTAADTAMSIAVVSGARGNAGQVRQVAASIGVLADTTGRAMELPVNGNYLNGLPTLEYFISTRGARKTLVDIALRTADSGYLTRKLVDVSQDVFTIDEDDSDPGFTMLRSDAQDVGVTFGSRLEGRYAADTFKMDGKTVLKRGDLITAEIAEAIHEDESIEEVKIMSVLTAPNLDGIPVKSYGIDPANSTLVVSSHPIGVIAAQSIGEPGTQLSLDSKHTGGVASISDETSSGLNRVTELFEARAPKGVAFVSEIAGAVRIWEDNNHYVVQVTSDDAKAVELELEGRKAEVASGTQVAKGDVLASKGKGDDPLIAPEGGVVEVTKTAILLTPSDSQSARYEVPGFKQLVVEDGGRVEQGGRLTTGSLNLHELMALRGVEETQRYILTEISKVFALQGRHVSDKHLEVVIRQMFSRVQIDDIGDSELVNGDIVSKVRVNEINSQLAAEGKELVEYSQLLLGITKVSTLSDSFLSAASFQDTTRVLIGAATSGRVDNLKGLKENVILGRKIPVGTGAHLPADDEDESTEVDQEE